MTLQNRACSYQYDALDRLASRFSTERGTTRHFYCANRLVTERGGSEHRAYIHGSEQLLAWQIGVAKMISTALIAPDRSNSVLAMIAPGQNAFVAYSPYGHRANTALLPGLPGFNGEHPDPLTDHYLLGNGYRAFNPVLMRFNSPDSLSPFGEGGLNGYAYCQGDPVNCHDPSGRVSWQFIVGMTLSVAALLTATVALFPSLPFLLSVEAAQAGFVSAGSLSTMVTGVASVAGGALSVTRQIVQEVAPDSPLLEPLGWSALILGLTAASTRVGSVIAARNPRNLANIKQAIEKRGMPILVSGPSEVSAASQIRGVASSTSASLRLNNHDLLSVRL